MYYIFVKYIAEKVKVQSMKNDAFELPESLYEFAQITDFPKVIESLSDLAEKEDWTYRTRQILTRQDIRF